MKILVLSTWFPYPKNQGSKTRAYHLIHALAQQNEVALVAFEDTPVKQEWLAEVHQVVEKVETLPKNPFIYSKLKTTLGFFSPKPSAVVAGYSREMDELIEKIISQWNPDLIFAFTYVMAVYVQKYKNITKIVDIDNLLAIMLYENYRAAKTWPGRIRRYLAYIKLRNYESKIYRQFDRCLVVSDLDKFRAQEYIPVPRKKIINVPNGVEISKNGKNQVSKDDYHLIYNGALTYEPNFDAMRFFLDEIFPVILDRFPNTHLSITGKCDGVPIDQLCMNDNVSLTGYLDDIQSAVAAATICIVPLRKGAGTRLKILESMASGTVVVSTSKGAEGLAVDHGKHLLIADSPIDFAHAVIRLLQDQTIRAELQENAYNLVRTIYDWQIIEKKFSNEVSTLTNYAK